LRVSLRARAGGPRLPRLSAVRDFRLAAVGLAAILALVAGSRLPAAAAERPAPARIGDFRLSDLLVPAEHVVSGGPGRDDIKSVDAPEFAAPSEARWVAANTPVLGLEVDGDARAYPVHVVERHQIVNDVVGGRPVVVTFDPLAGSPLAFERKVGDRTLDFGVAGLLYNGNFLLYDRQTESLWSQLRGQAIAGELSGTRLVRITIRQETMGMWASREPETRVMKPPIKEIDYRYSPFSSYWLENRIRWRVDATDPRFHAKEVVVGVEVAGQARAYLGSLVTEAGGRIRDELGGREIEIEYSTDDAVFRWSAPDGVSVTEAYWFAWKAFHPDTEVWKDPGDIPPPEF
jgi:hypothetical protein